jgi:hypothetical protein
MIAFKPRKALDKSKMGSLMAIVTILWTDREEQAERENAPVECYRRVVEYIVIPIHF